MIKAAKTISAFQFMDMFPGEDLAVEFVEKQIWGGTPICPHCQSARSFRIRNTRGHRCSSCLKNYTVRKGTIFEDSKLPLRTWLYAMYLLATSRKGVSSLQLSKEIGITQKSAWFMLHRLREACKSDDGEMLMGIVEIDETYIGGKEHNKHAGKRRPGSQGGSGKRMVLGMKQRGGKLKAMPIADAGGATLTKILRATIARPGVICTDEHRGYAEIGGYKHHTVNHSAKQYVDGLASTNSVESVWAVLKRGFYGTYHQFSSKHLRRYVDECVFRLNEGNCAIDTVDRIKSLVALTAEKRITYSELTR